MNWLKDIFTRLVMWWTKRRVKKIAQRLDSSVFIDVDSLPEAPVDPYLADEDDETNAFEKGF